MKCPIYIHVKVNLGLLDFPVSGWNWNINNKYLNFSSGFKKMLCSLRWNHIIRICAVLLWKWFRSRRNAGWLLGVGLLWIFVDILIVYRSCFNLQLVFILRPKPNGMIFSRETVHTSWKFQNVHRMVISMCDYK